MLKKFLSISLLTLTFILPLTASAAKSPTPRITEIAGINTENVRVHFQLNPIKSGEMVRVKYKLKTRKFNDVKYKVPKKAKRSGTVGAAASAKGSAIDFHNLPVNSQKFIYEVKVKTKAPGKSWSNWSNTYSF